MNDDHRHFANDYGYFDAERKEYVITRPDTPTPWLNYLGAGGYGGIISHTAGGYSFDRDPRHRRVTRYRYNALPADQPGRYIYLRDQESGLYWSPTWQPVTGRALQGYCCRHGPGYTRITGRYAQIAAEVLYFVPAEDPATDCAPGEIWLLRVRNLGPRPRYLRSFTYAEFSYWDAIVDQQNMDWGMHILSSRQHAGVLKTSTVFRPTVSFFSSNRPPIGFDTDREVFVGPCRDLSNPRTVESGEPGNSQAPRGNNIASLCHDLVLEPGEEQEIVYFLGITDQPAQIAPTLARYGSPEQVDQVFQALQADWQEYLECFTVQTPDAAMNAMLGLWNPLQCRTTLYWSRFVSGYETGLGRGLGTRDLAQDTLAAVHAAPAEVRRRLAQAWAQQFGDGHVWHLYFPLGGGGPGLASEFPQWPQWFCDDHLWLVLATCAYLRETGEMAFLEEPLPYQDGGQGTLWEHLQRAIDFTLAHRGPHGLPRLGFSDWDDTMNLDHGSGRAESVWCGEQFCRVCLDMAALCAHLGRPNEAERFRALHAEMATVIQEAAWDGQWYARAYDDEGRPVGVQGEELHRINLNPQTWAVIGEIGQRERLEQAMESAHRLLNTPAGLALLWPAYRGFQERIRGTTTYPPGAKENGGIFCHAHAWAIIAAAMLGWAERALEYYHEIVPLTRSDVAHTAVEPYVYCQNICGPEHPQYGRGRNSWLTGTASWAYVAATQHILGIRPTYDGLEIAPVIPASWPGFQAERRFRGVLYRITVRRAGPGSEIALAVDGRPVPGRVVPLPPPGQQEVEVQVTLS